MTTSTVSRPAFRLAVVAVLLVAILGTNVQRADALAVVPGVSSAVGTSMGIGVAAAGAGIIAGALIIGWAATGEAPWEWLDGDPDAGTGADPEWTVTNGENTWWCPSGMNSWCPNLNLTLTNLRYDAGADRMRWTVTKHAGTGGNTQTLYARCEGSGSWITVESVYKNPGDVWDWVWDPDVPCGAGVAHELRSGRSTGGDWLGGTSSVQMVSAGIGPGEAVESRMTYTCRHPDGSTTAHTRSLMGTRDAPAPMPATQCPAGSRLQTLKGERVREGVAPYGVYEWDADAPNAGTGVGLDDPTNDLAHCYYAGVSYGCRLELQKLIDSSAMLWADCLTLGTQCAGWLEHPNRDDIYRCTAVDARGLVAPKVVPLHDCRVFGPTFEPETQGDVETIPKVDDPEEDPKKLPIPPPNPNPDPEGDDLPYPDDGEQFDPDPRPDEDGDGLPDPRPGISPTNPDLDPSPGATPGLDDGCVPRWWEVLTPWGATKAVACALQWAFVPSPATMTRLQQVPQTATTKAPFGWFSPMLGALDGFDGASSQCWVIDVTMPQGWLGASAPDDERTVHILDSCSDEPLVQAIHNLRPLLTVLAYSSLIMPILWWAWRTYAPASTSSA